MDRIEFERQLKELESEYNKQRNAICIAYCKENNKVNIGDVVTNRHGESIIVDKITYTMGWKQNNPECVYHGIELTKKLAPKKSGARGTIYQSNLEY